MAEQTCGCNGELSGESLDGEPWIERTTDIGFCPKHDAVDDLIAALEEIAEECEGTYAGMFRDALSASEIKKIAQDAIRKAKG